MSKWFFVASPKTHNAEWEDFALWDKRNGHYVWGIPDKKENMDKLNSVRNGDKILCYVAAPKTKLIGYCICKGTYDDGSEPGFSHGVYVDNLKIYREPIRFSELRTKGFVFITDFLGENNGRGRSIVEISEDDWVKYQDFYHSRELKRKRVKIGKLDVKLKRVYE